MVRIAVFASGTGTNFENIVNRINDGTIQNASVKLLVVDKEHAKAIERAKQLNIPWVYVNPKAFPSKMDYEKEILGYLQKKEIQLIALAGYMRIVSPVLLEAYPRRIVNLHPAYLPYFPGKQSILDAYNAKVSETGVTLHYLDEGIDTGPIIHQEKIMIDPEWTLEILEEHVHALEYKMYPEVLNQLCDRIEKGEC